MGRVSPQIALRRHSWGGGPHRSAVMWGGGPHRSPPGGVRGEGVPTDPSLCGEGVPTDRLQEASVGRVSPQIRRYVGRGSPQIALRRHPWGGCPHRSAVVWGGRPHRSPMGGHAVACAKPKSLQIALGKHLQRVVIYQVQMSQSDKSMS